MAKAKGTAKEKPGPEKGEGGRPKVRFDFKKFEQMCNIQCTLIEIAQVLGVSEDTVERRCKAKYKTTFADAFKRFSSGGKASLRASQFRLAKKGNATLCIWLGKQYLNQREPKQEFEGILNADERLSQIADALAQSHTDQPSIPG